MIIVKITILLIVLTFFYGIAFKIWAETNPIDYMVDNFPKWSYGLPFIVSLDAIGILVSVIYLLFFM